MIDQLFEVEVVADIALGGHGDGGMLKVIGECHELRAIAAGDKAGEGLAELVRSEGRRGRSGIFEILLFAESLRLFALLVCQLTLAFKLRETIAVECLTLAGLCSLTACRILSATEGRDSSFCVSANSMLLVSS